MANPKKQKQAQDNRAFNEMLKSAKKRLEQRPPDDLAPVSYTHLDVYKRQPLHALIRFPAAPRWNFHSPKGAAPPSRPLNRPQSLF